MLDYVAVWHSEQGRAIGTDQSNHRLVGGRRLDWTSKTLFAEVDTNLVEFLKSGAAKVQVQVSVRLEFEAPVDHFMMTREPYFGRGMPHIGDELYLPYRDEARAALGVALVGCLTGVFSRSHSRLDP